MGTSPKVDRILFATDFLAAFQSDDRHGAYSKAEFLFNVQDDWGCGGRTEGSSRQANFLPGPLSNLAAGAQIPCPHISGSIGGTARKGQYRLRANLQRWPRGRSEPELCSAIWIGIRSEFPHRSTRLPSQILLQTQPVSQLWADRRPRSRGQLIEGSMLRCSGKFL
jgi:hypothetical protein